MKPKGAGVLYLLKDRFQIYTNLNPDIVEFQFPPNTVRDLCVINKELLEKEVVKFIQEKGIGATNLIIVISDEASCITDIDQETLSKDEMEFQNHVPADQIIVRKMHPSGPITLYATNQTLYQTIQKAFEKQGSTIEFVLPGYIFANSLSAASSLTLEAAGAVFKDAISHKAYNLLLEPLVFGEQETTMVREERLERQQRKIDVLRLYAMANIFGVLIIAVLVVWNITHIGPSQTYQGKAGTEQVIMPELRETKDLTVHIVSDRPFSADARSLKKLLAKYNFKAITLQRQRFIKEKNAVVIFSGQTSPTVRSAVLIDVKKYAADVTFRDDANAAFDITIILAGYHSQ